MPKITGAMRFGTTMKLWWIVISILLSCTSTLTQSITGNDSPDAVCSYTWGSGLGLAPVNFVAVSCDKRDTDEPESSIISVLIPPTLPKMLAACDLIVATTMVLLGLTGMGDACCPW